MNPVSHAHADKLPRDVYAPFTVSLKGGRSHTFLPQVLWPHDPATHAQLFLEEQLQPCVDACEQAGGATDPPSSGSSAPPSARPVPALLTYHPLAPYIIAYPRSARLPPHDALYFLEAFLGVCLVDRTATLRRLHPVRVLDPLPARDPAFRQPFGAVCDARARAILADATAHDLDVRVLVAEVDTERGVEQDRLLCAPAAALAALLRVATTGQRDRLVVVHDGATLPRTRPRFYRVLAPLRERTPEPGYSAEDVAFRWTPGERNFLVVTGGCARALLRGARVAPHTGLSARAAVRATGTAPWRDALPQLLEACHALPRGAGPAWRAVFERQTWRAPVRVASVDDFLWWIGFSCGWQKAVLRIVERRERPCADVMNRVVHFFRAEEFQQWVFQRRGAGVVDAHDWEAPIREYLHEATNGDDGSFARIRAVAALRPRSAASFGSSSGSSFGSSLGSSFAQRARFEEPVTLGLDENFEHVRFGRHGISLDRLCEKYDYTAPSVHMPGFEAVCDAGEAVRAAGATHAGDGDAGGKLEVRKEGLGGTPTVTTTTSGVTAGTANGDTKMADAKLLSDTPPAATPNVPELAAPPLSVAKSHTLRQWAFTYRRRKPLGSRVKQLRSLVRFFRLGGTGRR